LIGSKGDKYYRRAVAGQNDITIKGLQLILQTLYLLVPRDRIELPTRGFSGQIGINLKANDFYLLFDIIGFFVPGKLGKVRLF